MRLLLLLVACVGLSNANSYQEVEYGKSYKIRLNRKAQSIEFTPQDGSTVSILWKRSDPKPSEDSRIRVSGNVFVRNRMSMRDSGLYRVRDEDQRTQLAETVDVITPVHTYTVKPEETLIFSSDLDTTSCNIYFFPNDKYEVELVLSGMEQYDFYNSDCSGFEYTKPCKMTNENVPKACTGRFEIRDDNQDHALVVNLEVQTFNAKYLAIGGFILAVILIGCCATRCFCRGSESKNKKSASNSDPPVQYHEYEHEPAGPRQNQLSQPPTTRYSAHPSSATTGPLIHNPPVNVPPAYSQVFSHEQQPSTAYTPLCSDPEPRFELKGMNFNLASPLSSDSTHGNVYTSDKLNFL